jgi:alcohol dehydrogenase, propanol-preferring
MLAAVVHQFKAPLQLEEVPVPEPGLGEVLVRVEAAGLCHTDIHAAHGDWPVKPKLPLIPGHEGVGIVTALGPGVTEVAEGDRVAIPWLGWACGACESCASGWETLCLGQHRTGYSVDGSYAQYVKASARYVGHVPNGMDSFEAAPLTCAGVTTYKAVKVAKARPSDLVAVYGIGGLGHLTLQYAKIAGATVAAVDLVDDKLRLARELGADYAIDARAGDPAAAIQQLGGADAAIVLAAAPAAFEQAFRSLRPGGRLVLVGLPADNEMRLPIFETVLNGIQVLGSIVGTRVDLAEVFELHARGRTHVTYQRRPLESVNESFADVLAGRVLARIVLDLGSVTTTQ